MRFLIELELITLVPLVIDAETEEAALGAFRSAREGELLAGDPEPQESRIVRITALGPS